jgi:hypothetical protein
LYPTKAPAYPPVKLTDADVEVLLMVIPASQPTIVPRLAVLEEVVLLSEPPFRATFKTVLPP